MKNMRLDLIGIFRLYILMGITLGNGFSDQQAVQFSQEMYTFSVNETTPTTPRPTAAILTVQCRHFTDNSTDDISYQGVSNGSVTVNISTGEVVVVDDLDYETNTFVILEVQCQSSRNESWTDRSVVNVTIFPINEYRPEVSTSTETVVVMEGEPIGTVLVSTLPGGKVFYTASDRDSGPDGNLFYSIFSISDNVTFGFNSTIGAIFLAQSFDLDAAMMLLRQELVRFTVCDSSPPTPDCLNIAVTLVLAVGNDNAPLITPSHLNVSFPEDVGNSTVIAQFQCSDADFVRGAFGGFEIMTILPPQTPQGTFTITTEGQIMRRAELDFEFTEYYELTIRCFDLGQREDIAVLLINITAVNDNSPRFLNLSHNITVSESVDINSTIVQIQCVDDDVGQGEINNYDVVMVTPIGTPIEIFAVDCRGNFSNSVLLDFESTDQYEVQVRCYDYGFPVMFDTTMIFLTIEDANDNFPECLVEDQDVSVGVYSHEQIVILNCTDKDSGMNSELRYTLDSIVPPLENGQFILNSFTGELSFLGLAAPSGNHTVTIIVSDQGTPSNSINVSFVAAIKGNLLNSPRIIFPLWGIIVLIVIGLLLICIILICFMFCCYTSCTCGTNNKKEYYLNTNYKTQGEGLVIPQYPLTSMKGSEKSPDSGSYYTESTVTQEQVVDYRSVVLRFQTTALDNGSTSFATPTTASENEQEDLEDDEGIVYTTSTDFILNPGATEAEAMEPTPPEVTITVETPDPELNQSFVMEEASDNAVGPPGVDYSRDILVTKEDSNEAVTGM